jgi:SAM-dependent methyltransferase
MYQILQRNFDMIQYLVTNASHTQLCWRESESGWSLGEIVGHLCAVEQRHARLNLPETICTRQVHPPKTGANGKGEQPASFQAFTAYARYRRETIVRLQHAPPAQWQQPVATDPQVGAITLAEFVEKVDSHDRLHIEQMEHVVQRMPLNPLLARALQEIEEYHRRYQRYLTGAASGLDIGVGPGLALQHIMSQNPQLAFAGVDIRDLRLPGIEVPLLVYEGHTLPFQDSEFDVVLLFYVLHHCCSPARLLSEAVRVARQKLIIIEEFCYPAADEISLDMTERQSHRALGIPPDLPYQLFNKAELAAMLQAHHLWEIEHQSLPSQTTRPVRKYLYVLAKEQG